ncbi:MAG: S9 family peptidase, partial [Gemmatimonadaceae bacterium]
MLFRPRYAALFMVVAFVVSFVPAARAQDGYREPPEAIRQILDAEPTPSLSVSPDKRTLLLMRRPALPSIDKVAAPDLRLAGIRFDPSSNGPSRESSLSGLSLMPVSGGEARPVSMTLPAGASISNPRWSPASDKIAFTVSTDNAITIWVADVASATARQLSPRRLNGILGAPCDWMSNSALLLCTFVPEGRGAAPQPAARPQGPIIQEAGGSPDRVATYQDLLRSPHDEALFAHYTTAQLAKVSLDGSVTNIGQPGMFYDASVSPDGRFILAYVLHTPFSYTVPMYYFPTRMEIWDANGVMVKRLYDRPLVERVPWGGDAAVPGPRNAEWRADQPATVVWLEALDNGDPTVAAAKRDKVMALATPFTAEPTKLVETEFRANSITWGNATLAIARERFAKTRRARTWIIDPSRPGNAPRLLFDVSSEDRYGDPGNVVTTTNAQGHEVLALTPDGKSAFLRGAGASPEGDRPFLDQLNLATGKTTRLFHSAAPSYEAPIALLDARGQQLLTSRESKSEAPNYFTRDLARRTAPRQLTRFSDPAPAFAGVTSELVTYKRADGVQLSATLYLPPGYDKARDGTLPFFFWAYPLEYRSREAASQVVGSPFRFVRPSGSSHLFMLLQGYGVLDNPTMPIVGENGAEPNDTYVEQLTA